MRWVLVFLFTTSFAIAQETKFVRKISPRYVEEYYVLKSEKKMKHGTYVKYIPNQVGFNLDVDILEAGSYKNGLKVGVWEYFYKDSYDLKEKGAYENGKKNGVWLRFFPDTTRNSVTKEINKGTNQKRTESIDILINQSGSVVMQAGIYLNDVRKGEWLSFDISGKQVQKYNYTSSLLLMDKSISDSLQLPDNHRPVYFGGLPAFGLKFWTDFNSEAMGLLDRDSIGSILSVEISEVGTVKRAEVISSSGSKAYDKHLVDVVKRTSSEWIPAKRDGKLVSQTITLQHSAKIVRTIGELQQWRYFNRID